MNRCGGSKCLTASSITDQLPRRALQYRCRSISRLFKFIRAQSADEKGRDYSPLASPAPTSIEIWKAG